MGGVESVIINKAGLDTILRAALRVSVDTQQANR